LTQYECSTTVTPEYQARAERDAEATRAHLEAPDAKLALVVYSTG